MVKPTKQQLYRNALGRFISPKSVCSKDCSIFFFCKKKRLDRLGTVCNSRARLPPLSVKEPISFKQYDLQERELRRCACEGIG